MITKKVNIAITYASHAARIFIILYLAVLLAHFIWWVASPIVPDIYVQKMVLNQYENSIKYINNRSPFGVIVIPKAPPPPPILNEIKLTGVYVNTPQNSMAFVELSGKPMVVQVGDIIAEDVKLKEVHPDSIVVTEGGTDTNISMTGGTAVASNMSISSGNRWSNSTPQQNSGPNQANYSQQQNYSQPQNQGQANNAEDFEERRKKMLEMYMDRIRQNNSNY
jgi:hypothetical protein